MYKWIKFHTLKSLRLVDDILWWDKGIKLLLKNSHEQTEKLGTGRTSTMQ